MAHDLGLTGADLNAAPLVVQHNVAIEAWQAIGPGVTRPVDGTREAAPGSIWRLLGMIQRVRLVLGCNGHLTAAQGRSQLAFVTRCVTRS
jgi:hypothetical protein